MGNYTESKRNIHNTNINKRCPKCLSVLGNKRVKDYEGKEFCCKDCLKDYYAENRKEMECRYNDFMKLDDWERRY